MFGVAVTDVLDGTDVGLTARGEAKETVSLDVTDVGLTARGVAKETVSLDVSTGSVVEVTSSVTTWLSLVVITVEVASIVTDSVLLVDTSELLDVSLATTLPWVELCCSESSLICRYAMCARISAGVIKECYKNKSKTLNKVL